MIGPTTYDVKERIRQAIDIVELVGSYLPLRREGRGYKALCPWHDDTRPSLQVNPERQSFKCWVCDLGGDIFSFTMKMENVDFPAALAMLAERAGIQLEPSRGGPKSAGEVDEKQLLYHAVAWAEEQFHRYLQQAAEAEPARQYLAERKITSESVNRFRLGFSPNRWDWLIKQSLNNDISAKTLEAVGLIVRRQDGPGHYDRFRGRAMFPIRDVQGRPVAFGGRILPQFAEENPAKYINSPESPLFSKSSMLYALDSARDEMGRSRNAVVMEGYTDTIVARQFGFDNTVAVLGTALGERHIRLLRRFADSITLVLDGDEAGQHRANEILGLFVAEQIDLRIVTLPDDLGSSRFFAHARSRCFSPVLGLGRRRARAQTKSIDAKHGLACDDAPGEPGAGTNALHTCRRPAITVGHHGASALAGTSNSFATGAAISRFRRGTTTAFEGPATPGQTGIGRPRYWVQ